MTDDRAETRAAEKIALAAMAKLTGRTGEPLRYAMIDDSPVGPLGLARGAKGLSFTSFTTGEDDFLERLLAGGLPVIKSHALDPVKRALDRYFAGKRLDFDDLEVDLSAMSGFSRRVLEETAKIPVGRYLSYQQVAAKAGSPNAMRAAGNALHNNPVCIIVPCHRILKSDGSLGGYGGGPKRKEWLLRHEGAIIA